MTEDERVIGFGARYFDWLVDLVGGEDHLRLFLLLNDIPFEWMPDVPMDENQEKKGRWMRVVFEDATGCTVPSCWDEWHASFLEVMVSLAWTMEHDIMYNKDTTTGIQTWFWMMMQNMGISQCDDRWMRQRGPDGDGYILDRVSCVMERTYDADGDGGLFPLERTLHDQRKVDLWHQMNGYILEKGWY